MINIQKNNFSRKFIYALNILTAIYVVFTILFSVGLIVRNYSNLIKSSHEIEKTYDEILNKYKKMAIFILKYNLPKNINYFNLSSQITFDLSPIKEFKIIKPKDVIASGGDNTTLNNDSNSMIAVAGCHNSKCIRVLIDAKEILDKISKSRLWEHDKITTIPIKRMTLLKISVLLFLEAYKYFFIISLLYLFLLYLFQSLFLFTKNWRITKIYDSLRIAADKNKQKLIKQSNEHDILHNNILFIQEFANEYFIRYVPHLIVKDIFIEEINLNNVFLRIKEFLSYQLAKRSLNIVLDYKDDEVTVGSNSEILFIVLLNLMFRAIYRSKISSDIVINISQTEDYVNIEINDIGYDYNPSSNNKIPICDLSDAILEKLCRKIKITEIDESRNNEVNTIYVRMTNLKIEDPEEEFDNIITIKLNPL